MKVARVEFDGAARVRARRGGRAAAARRRRRRDRSPLGPVGCAPERQGAAARRGAPAAAGRAAVGARLPHLRAARDGDGEAAPAAACCRAGAGTTRRRSTSRILRRSSARTTTSRCRRAARCSTTSSSSPAVIGREARDVAPGEASAYIAGYTIFNDWSARDLQFAEMQVGLGPAKGKDSAITLGPWIVTPDELGSARPASGRVPERRADGRRHPRRASPGRSRISSRTPRAEPSVRAGDVLGSGTCGAGCLAELWERRGQARAAPAAARRRRPDGDRGDRRDREPDRRGRGAGAGARGAAARVTCCR